MFPFFFALPPNENQQLLVPVSFSPYISQVRAINFPLFNDIYIQIIAPFSTLPLDIRTKRFSNGLLRILINISGDTYFFSRHRHISTATWAVWPKHHTQPVDEYSSIHNEHKELVFIF